MAIGSLTLADLQATLNASTVYDIGLDRTFDAIQVSLDAHNRIMNELVNGMSERVTIESERYGGDDQLTMEDGDETAVPISQKVTAGSNVGYPLNLAMIGQQRSEMWFRKHTLQELAAQVNGIMAADKRRVIRDLKRAIFYSANYTHTDHLVRNVDIPVKRLVNADSAPLPPGPNGETFTASSHTHYLARAGGSLASTDVDGLINTVKEHYATGEIILAINSAQEATVRNFTGFVAYPDPRVAQSVNADRAAVGRLDVINLYDRPIGLYNGAEVWIKSWVPASYLYAYNAMAPKILAYRYDPDYGDGLQLVYENDQYPWQARGWRRVFGFGVRNRIAAAALYSGATSYADPTIN